MITWDNGQGDPNGDDSGLAFALNSQVSQGVAFSVRPKSGMEQGWNSNLVFSTNGHGSWREGMGTIGSQKARDPENGLVVGAFNGYAGGPDDNDAQAGHIIASTLNSGGNNGGFRTEPGEHIIPFDTTQITSPENRSNPLPGAPSHPLAAGAHPPAIISFAWQQGVSENDRSYPVRQGDYSGSITGSRVDAVAGQFGIRRLTPTECERLQGFPDGHTQWGIGEDGSRVEISDSARYRMLGNAVCRKVTAWLGKRLRESLDKENRL